MYPTDIVECSVFVVDPEGDIEASDPPSSQHLQSGACKWELAAVAQID